MSSTNSSPVSCYHKVTKSSLMLEPVMEVRLKRRHAPLMMGTVQLHKLQGLSLVASLENLYCLGIIRLLDTAIPSYPFP